MAESTAAEAPAKEPVKCALPNCPARFVPKAETHKYCSATCKKRAHTYRFALNGGR